MTGEGGWEREDNYQREAGPLSGTGNSLHYVMSITSAQQMNSNQLASPKERQCSLLYQPFTV